MLMTLVSWQVVQFIRASRETHSGELVLLIQRNGVFEIVTEYTLIIQSIKKKLFDDFFTISVKLLQFFKFLFIIVNLSTTAYLNDASPGEPDFQYIPDSHHMVAVLPPQVPVILFFIHTMPFIVIYLSIFSTVSLYKAIIYVYLEIYNHMS